jgi:hypothetical protein
MIRRAGIVSCDEANPRGERPRKPNQMGAPLGVFSESGADTMIATPGKPRDVTVEEISAG